MRDCWVIPPKHNAEFVANMEDVLDLYERAYDADCPVVCMDEQPVQLVAETRPVIPMTPGGKQKYDYEYRRAGTAVNFLFTEPLQSWRKVNVRRRKTKIDWAEEIRELPDEDYPPVAKVILICDNLNTHVVGSLYEAFDPARRGLGRTPAIKCMAKLTGSSVRTMPELNSNICIHSLLLHRFRNDRVPGGTATSMEDTKMLRTNWMSCAAAGRPICPWRHSRRRTPC